MCETSSCSRNLAASSILPNQLLLSTGLQKKKRKKTRPSQNTKHNKHKSNTAALLLRQKKSWSVSRSLFFSHACLWNSGRPSISWTQREIWLYISSAYWPKFGKIFFKRVHLLTAFVCLIRVTGRSSSTRVTLTAMKNCANHHLQFNFANDRPFIVKTGQCYHSFYRFCFNSLLFVGHIFFASNHGGCRWATADKRRVHLVTEGGMPKLTQETFQCCCEFGKQSQWIFFKKHLCLVSFKITFHILFIMMEPDFVILKKPDTWQLSESVFICSKRACVVVGL